MALDRNLASSVNGAPILKEIAAPQDALQFEQLLNRTFPVAPGTSFFDDFPIWSNAFRDRYEVIRLGLFNSASKLMACAGIRPHLAFGSKLGMIGAVSTDADYQSQGLASQLILELEKRARGMGIENLVLWSSKGSLYERLGFVATGIQRRVALQDLDFGNTDTVSFQTGLSYALFQKLLTRSGGVQLQASDFPYVQAHKNILWVSTAGGLGVSAYVAIGKGIDLQGIIHEWGGERSDICSLLATIKSRAPELQIIGSNAQFTAAGIVLPTNALSESVCLVKNLSEKKLSSEKVWFWGLDSA